MRLIFCTQPEKVAKREKFQFIVLRAKLYQVNDMCRVLNVSEQGYYYFLRNLDIDDSYLDLLEDILECINEESGNTFYGFRCVYRWLRIYKGYSGLMNKIHKILKENGLLVKNREKALNQEPEFWN